LREFLGKGVLTTDLIQLAQIVNAIDAISVLFNTELIKIREFPSNTSVYY